MAFVRSTPFVTFLAAVAVFGAVAGPRLSGPSPDRHFVAQADAWLHGRLHLDGWPPGADDPAFVEEVALDDGTVVRGRRLATREAFRIAGGREIPLARIRQSRGVEYHVAFPPFPSAVFVPIVLLFGPSASDVVATVLLAALAPALLLLVIERLRSRGLSTCSPGDAIWMAILLAFGTVFFFSAVQGRVWYTAHVIGVDLCLLYVWASIDAERPWLAGVCVGLAFLTRGPMLFMFPLFAAELWRTGRWSDWRRWMAFAVPVVLLGAIAAWHNDARFGEPLEFGYKYLAVTQKADMERFGLFHLRFLPRNLTAAFLLLPNLSSDAPYVTISGHGVAVWATTPALLLLAVVKPRGTFHRGLWITAASVAIWTLLYQNTGWVQFGYRFSLDCIVFLILILAVDSRPLTTAARALILVSVVINLFGALTFGRYSQFYRTDAAAYRELVHD